MALKLRVATCVADFGEVVASEPDESSPPNERAKATVEARRLASEP
eukprot:CAMPEP_0204188232 /NCGR_PEP_ID=MMETSP0361-20130328/57478_1 /ASSEMBLY_ACC=CAM_ASM_000343 /TAXON_ID=268821 /ORGANISM="Scrippsiella Hangoei, Strain SHTV-5" /LENGTH=45 /DNA_ID= /DNA_START= /DNA_END= /DNA_ORIENTATION=